ncbi:MAG TPA: hypothetical protein PLJ78_09265 [Anaerolineae bacterium]|nr:hypothetical protein [Anaerolineae bacterium]HQK14116.1 hypothetical protein [Anaerolineae bacterium]
MGKPVSREEAFGLTHFSSDEVDGDLTIPSKHLGDDPLEAFGVTIPSKHLG